MTEVTRTNTPSQPITPPNRLLGVGPEPHLIRQSPTSWILRPKSSLSLTIGLSAVMCAAAIIGQFSQLDRELVQALWLFTAFMPLLHWFERSHHALRPVWNIDLEHQIVSNDSLSIPIDQVRELQFVEYYRHKDFAAEVVYQIVLVRSDDCPMPRVDLGQSRLPTLAKTAAELANILGVPLAKHELSVEAVMQKDRRLMVLLKVAIACGLTMCLYGAWSRISNPLASNDPNFFWDLSLMGIALVAMSVCLLRATQADIKRRQREQT